MSTLKYILRHGWFWPLEFWLRPFAVQKRGGINGKKEAWSALTGSVLTGTFLGLILWATGNIEPIHIWIIIVSLALPSIGSFNNLDIFIFSGSVAVIITFFIAGLHAAAVAGAIIFIFLVAHAAFNSTFFESFGSVAFFTLIAATGIALGEKQVTDQITQQLLLISTSSILIGAFGYRLLKKKEEAQYSTLLMATIVVILPSSSFGTFSKITVQETNILGLSLSITVVIAWISRMNILFFLASLPRAYKTKDAFHVILYKETLHDATIISNKSPILLFVLCWTLALAAWLNPLGSEALQNKLHILAAYFFAIPILSTGFLFYPLLIPASLWLYQSNRLTRHTSPAATPIINLWQSLTLPLPKLKQYLALLTERDIELGYETLRAVQTRSFQGLTARKAAQLVLNKKAGLSFSGYLAINTDEATLSQLIFGPPLARSVAVLPATDKEKIEGRDILLSIYKDPAQIKKKKPFGRSPEKESISNEPHETFRLEQQSIKERLTAARSFLAQSQECTGKEEYSSLLKTLEILSTPEDFQQLSQNRPHEFTPENISWLEGGWQLAIRLEKHHTGILQAYQSLNSIEAKKTYLRKQQERLKGIDWSNLPWFWAGIAEEIVRNMGFYL